MRWRGGGGGKGGGGGGGGGDSGGGGGGVDGREMMKWCGAQYTGKFGKNAPRIKKQIKYPHRNFHQFAPQSVVAAESTQPRWGEVFVDAQSPHLRPRDGLQVARDVANATRGAARSNLLNRKQSNLLNQKQSNVLKQKQKSNVLKQKQKLLKKERRSLVEVHDALAKIAGITAL